MAIRQRSAGFDDVPTKGYLDNIKIIKGGTNFGGAFTAPVCDAAEEEISRQYNPMAASLGRLMNR